MTQKIQKLYAWIATESDGGEGLAAAQLVPGGLVMPLIGADRARIEQLRETARTVSNSTGCKVDLVEFSTRRVIDY